MGALTDLYRRVDTWTRNRSRVEYAALTGLATGLAVLLFAQLLGDWVLSQAVAMAVTVAAVYYVQNPNS